MTTEARRRAAAIRLHDAFCAARGEETVRFHGRSMAPMLREGDWLRVRHTAPGDLSFGDLVVCDDGERWIVHRLVLRWNGRLWTKGDSASAADAPVAAERVLGKVIEVARGRRTIPLEGARYALVARAIALASLAEHVAGRTTRAARARLGRGTVSSPGGRRLRRTLERVKVALLGRLAGSIAPPSDPP